MKLPDCEYSSPAGTDRWWPADMAQMQRDIDTRLPAALALHEWRTVQRISDLLDGRPVRAETGSGQFFRRRR